MRRLARGRVLAALGLLIALTLVFVAFNAPSTAMLP